MLNRSLLLFLVIASGLSAAPDQATIKISTPKENVKAGSDVTIEVIFTNTSKNHIILVSLAKREDQGELDYTVEVQDSKSARAAETSRGHFLRTGEDSPAGETYIKTGSIMNLDVPPGGTVRSEILINRLYGLSKPGKYTIQVERTIGSSSVVIKSNALPVAVEN
jgi:hypothetical protein